MLIGGIALAGCASIYVVLALMIQAYKGRVRGIPERVTITFSRKALLHVLSSSVLVFFMAFADAAFRGMIGIGYLPASLLGENMLVGGVKVAPMFWFAVSLVVLLSSIKVHQESSEVE